MDKAINWWNKLTVKEKCEVFRKYFSSGITCLIDLKKEDIEKIFLNETGKCSSSIGRANRFQEQADG